MSLFLRADSEVAVGPSSTWQVSVDVNLVCSVTPQVAHDGMREGAHAGVLRGPRGLLSCF